ncbi:hypothetical protein BVRB_026590, partial [Beta vulgaris subsp. vulgaris]
ACDLPERPKSADIPDESAKQFAKRVALHGVESGLKAIDLVDGNQSLAERRAEGIDVASRGVLSIHGPVPLNSKVDATETQRSIGALIFYSEC